MTEPTTELNPRYSSPDAVATPWKETERLLREAELYWISTVRPGGPPHVTPLVGVWHEGALHFTTGGDERKALNLADDPGCVLTTGRNDWAAGLDVVVEGKARRVDDETRLASIADAYRDKYGDAWSFEVDDGRFFHEEGGHALVFEVPPLRAFAFGKGDPFSQTRYRFDG